MEHILLIDLKEIVPQHKLFTLNHQGSCQACLSAENFDQKERLANTHAVNWTQCKNGSLYIQVDC